MKSFVEFEFPEGEPEYTNIVLENIKQYESETLKTHDAGVMAIDRLMGKNPELKKALDAL